MITRTTALNLSPHALAFSSKNNKNSDRAMYNSHSRWKKVKIEDQHLHIKSRRISLRSPAFPSSKSTSRLQVFERMSEESISAIVTAQTQTNLYMLEYVDRQALLLGVIDQCSETRALERTMKKFKLTWRLAEKSFKEITMQQQHQSGNSDANNAGWLSGFRAAKQPDGDKDRPFSKEMKQTLLEAGKIANQMGSVTVCTHHIFLALLEYKDTFATGDRSATSKKNSSLPPSAASIYEVSTKSPWYLLKKMNSMDDNVTPLIICQTLMSNLKTMEMEDEMELVASGVGGRGGASSSYSSKTPTLNEYGTDLTQLAQDGLLDPVYGRSSEIRACIRTLIRRRKNNVCLIGEPGVGKTAIAEGVAQILIDEAACPKPLQGHRLISLELSSLVAGTKYRGEFEERIQSIIQEVTDPKTQPTILFIDEIHNLIGAGSATGGDSGGGTMDAANMLKPALARGAMQLIGATTIAEYRKYIEKDTALERRLQPVMVKEPTVAQTVGILQAVQAKYEKHHGVRYTSGALLAAAQLSERYITDRFLPDKALDLIDESGAVTQLDFLDRLDQQSIEIDTVDFENEQNDFLAGDGDDDDSDSVPVVTEHTVAAVMSDWSGIPIGRLEIDELNRLQSLESEMTGRVIGQDRAVRGVARAIRRGRSGMRDPNRPIASLLFCGPTGVGKTELCKTLASQYYGSEKNMIRIDMSEYMDQFTVSRLTGPPPGYVGYEAGGQLTEAVRRAPHSVVLFDEIEKAHEDVLNILLQLMEDGILTDGKGRTVNFKNTVIVMTSNVGSRRILELSRNHSRKSRSVLSNLSPLVFTAPTIDANSNTDSVSATKLPDIENLSSTSDSTNTLPPEPSSNDILGTVTMSSALQEAMRPDEILTKMQQKPQASALFLKAASDPDVMSAVRIAMNGSPADLIKEAQQNPAISSFLQELYSSLLDDDNNTSNSGSINSYVDPGNNIAQSPNGVVENVRNGATIEQKQQDDVSRSSSSLRASIEDDSTESNWSNKITDLSLKKKRDSASSDEDMLYPKLVTVVKEELESAMRPEFLNRIDEIVVFSPLSPSDLRAIAALAIEKIAIRALAEHAALVDRIIVNPCLLERITTEGSSNAGTYGARPMRRSAQRYIEDSLSDCILSGFFNFNNSSTVAPKTSMTLSMAPSKSPSGKEVVAIQRSIDGNIFCVTVEDASGGMGGGDGVGTEVSNRNYKDNSFQATKALELERERV